MGDTTAACPLCAAEHRKAQELRRSNRASAADKVSAPYCTAALVLRSLCQGICRTCTTHLFLRAFLPITRRPTEPLPPLFPYLWLQDSFFKQLRSAPDGFALVAEYFGRGLLNNTSVSQQQGG